MANATTTTGRSGSMLGSKTQLDVITVAVDPSEIRSIQLPDGWHSTENVELIQFAISQSHSPASPGKFYPALRYDNEFGQSVVTPLSNVLSLSSNEVSEQQKSRQAGMFAGGGSRG